MKKYLVVFSVLLLILSMSTSVFAQGPVGIQAFTGAQIVNLDTAAADLIVQYIAENGTVYNIAAGPIDPGKSITLFAEPKNVQTFKGAAIVSSSKKIAAIAKAEWASGVNGAAAYSSADAGSTSVTLPLIVIGEFGNTAAVSVQNTDLNNDITVNITYTPSADTAAAGNATFTRQMSIKAGASTSVKLGFDSDFKDRDAGAAGWLGSAVVSSSTDVVAVVHVDNNGKFVYGYNGFTNTGESTNFLPLIRNNFVGLLTGVQVANTNNTAGEVQIEYSGFVDSNGNFVEDGSEAYNCIDKATMPAGGSALFVSSLNYVNRQSGTCATSNHTGLPVGFLGNAKVTGIDTGNGTPNIVTVVNDQATNNSTSSAYNGFFSSDGKVSVVSPLARAGFANFHTGLQVQNIGGSAAAVTVTMTGFVDTNNNFVEDGGEAYTCTENANIAAGGSATFVPGVITPANGSCVNNTTTNAKLNRFLGAATITGPSGSQLVGITNDQALAGGADTAIFNMIGQ